MLRPAKILLVGTTAAMALFAGAASSQDAGSVATNDQAQSGAVIADQQLNVADVSDETVAVTSATANSFDATVEEGDLELQSQQAVSGGVSATTVVNVVGSSGYATQTNTTASGNVLDGGLYAGVLNASVRQDATGERIYANSYIAANEGETGTVSQGVQALANSAGFGMTHGAGVISAEQTNTADVIAEGGAAYSYVEGDATFSAAAAANNLTSVAVGNSRTRLDAVQSNDAGVVKALQYTTYGGAGAAITQATASGNNISANNETGPLDATTVQANSAFINAEAGNVSYEFGAGSAIAYGIGNSLVAGNYGPDLSLDVAQFNGGGVEVTSYYSGEYGYDATSSANAIGNGATGFACADCQGRMTINNHQANAADVAASSTLSINGAGRFATGTATAVGNTASYYVTRPGSGG